MFKQRHTPASRKSLLGLVLVLALVGLPLVIAACDDLTSDTISTTTIVEESTTTVSLVAASTTETEAAAPETTETTAPDTGGGDGDGSGDDPGGSSTGTTYTPLSLVVPHLFDNDDNREHATVSVGDNITVGLNFSSEDEVTLVEWYSDLPTIAELTGRGQALDEDEEFIVLANGYYRALSPGDTGLVCLARHEDGSIHLMWRLNLEVVE